MTRDYRLVPFRKWHLGWLLDGGMPAEGVVGKVPDDWASQLEVTNAWTGFCDGAVVGCAGTLEQWPGRHTCWAYFPVGNGEHMLAITRWTLDQLAKVPGRIEATVRKDFEAGHRWIRMLGFEVENPPGLLRAFGPDGADHIAYVRHNA